MKPALNHHDFVAFDAVHQAVFFVDAPRPKAGEVVFQCFGFADAGEGRGLNGIDQGLDSLDGFGIGLFPICQVARGAFGKAQFQRSTSTVLPSLASRTPCASAARLAAVEVR